jgi:hypothetical protein
VGAGLFAEVRRMRGEARPIRRREPRMNLDDPRVCGSGSTEDWATKSSFRSEHHGRARQAAVVALRECAR